MRPSRGGFTLLEIIMVIVIIGILTRIALPQIQEMKDRATAARLVGAIKVVENAAFQYAAANAQWPATAARQRIPAGLAGYLPNGFTFAQPDVQLRWRLLQAGNAEYGIIQAFATSVSICAKLDGVLGGARNLNIAATCRGANPRVDYYVDR